MFWRVSRLSWLCRLGVAFVIYTCGVGLVSWALVAFETHTCRVGLVSWVQIPGCDPLPDVLSGYSGTNSDGLVYYTCLRAICPGTMPSKQIARRTVACVNPSPPFNSGLDTQLEWACGFQEPSTC